MVTSAMCLSHSVFICQPALMIKAQDNTSCEKKTRVLSICNGEGILVKFYFLFGNHIISSTKIFVFMSVCYFTIKLAIHQDSFKPKKFRNNP